MKTEAKHTVLSKLTIAVLIMALLTPSFVKLAHAFANHEHDICIDYQETHLHEFDVECEFYKFKINNPYALTLFEFDVLDFNSTKQLNSELYSFKYFHRQLSFLLRAPPAA